MAALSSEDEGPLSSLTRWGQNARARPGRRSATSDDVDVQHSSENPPKDSLHSKYTAGREKKGAPSAPQPALGGSRQLSRELQSLEKDLSQYPLSKEPLPKKRTSKKPARLAEGGAYVSDDEDEIVFTNLEPQYRTLRKPIGIPAFKNDDEDSDFTPTQVFPPENTSSPGASVPNTLHRARRSSDMRSFSNTLQPDSVENALVSTEIENAESLGDNPQQALPEDASRKQGTSKDGPVRVVIGDYVRENDRMEVKQYPPTKYPWKVLIGHWKQFPELEIYARFTAESQLVLESHEKDMTPLVRERYDKEAQYGALQFKDIVLINQFKGFATETIQDPIRAVLSTRLPVLTKTADAQLVNGTEGKARSGTDDAAEIYFWDVEGKFLEDESLPSRVVLKVLSAIDRHKTAYRKAIRSLNPEERTEEKKDLLGQFAIECTEVDVAWILENEQPRHTDTVSVQTYNFEPTTHMAAAELMVKKDGTIRQKDMEIAEKDAKIAELEHQIAIYKHDNLSDKEETLCINGRNYELCYEPPNDGLYSCHIGNRQIQGREYEQHDTLSEVKKVDVEGTTAPETVVIDNSPYVRVTSGKQQGALIQVMGPDPVEIHDGTCFIHTNVFVEVKQGAETSSVGADGDVMET
ncbi:hypothetical protein PVAG01_07928 [Phlyctema vagabunda]|uniref:Uncharacterized protein n=1 Tax=Phlyctema vagabunda TaxID=108571 RepID=A0ABR4PDU3_9HELO